MIVTIDFETFWSQDYSLSRMSEVEYITSPLFQVIMCSIKFGDQAPQICYGRDQCAVAFAGINWDDVALLAHNTRFDGAILAWHFGHRPRLYLDTLSMARGVTHIYAGRSSLAALADYMGMPAKGSQVNTYKGYRLENFTQAELRDYADYCEHDNELSYDIFQRFMDRGFPTSELRVIDLMLRMFIEPQVRLNSVVLAENLANVRAQIAQKMALVAHIPKETFASNEKFAGLLVGLGVDVPMKISKTTGRPTYALARNDPGFRELCEDEGQSDAVQAVLAARLATKSTIEETRSVRLLSLAMRDEGWFNVPYRYYGAHTGRPSGDGGINAANFKRGSMIRKSIHAPKGKRIVHRDSSQIECRTLGWLAGDDRLMADFRAGVDIYSDFASEFYQQKVTKADVQRRFVGKTCILGLGYGMSGPKLRTTLYIGNGGVSVTLRDDETAWSLVNYYRARHQKITVLWNNAGTLLYTMTRNTAPRRGLDRGEGEYARVGIMLKTQGEAVILPNGMALQYPNLRLDLNSVNSQWLYDTPTGERHIYGAKLVENICQALARIIVTDIMLAVYERTGHRPFMSTYDAHDYVVNVDEAERFDQILAEEFARAPAWCADLPLASEGGWGRNLLEAERGVNQ